MDLDAACLSFELAWKSGQRPRVRDYLSGVAGPLRAPLVRELVALDVAYRRRLGEQPGFGDYMMELPGEEEAVRAAFETDTPAASAAAGDVPTRVRAPQVPHGPTQSATFDTDKAPDSREAPAIKGYEILGELGKGGMGIVYKARQLALNRIVALKMIRVDAHAGEHIRARFRTEAEAVARVQHANIVQIYEVGEQDGRPFFSMEFVEGGSLASHLDGQPLPAAEAAHLLETLARAMQHAHDRGIIHRDLKPGNVLLSFSREPPASATITLAGGSRLHEIVPKITDFGLAKLVDVEQGQTQSGEMIGTPGYMAPEQVASKPRGIGPAADVWALGAILYELLTGRPPFRAATALDTVFLVLSEEPTPPRRLRSNVPRDLETICLKCLEKERSRRYASAAALADDLHRFLAGEPVQARPVGLLTRLARRIRRHPARAAACGLALLCVLLLARIEWNAGSPSPLPSGAIGVAPSAPEPIAILTLKISHYRGKDFLGSIGVSSHDLRANDDLRIHAELSGPAYCYLIAFNPDGKEQLCYPECKDLVVPEKIARLSYPFESNQAFPLTDGVGLQAFVLLVSRQPLLPYAEWRANVGTIPWQATAAPKGFWRFNGHDFEGAERGPQRDLQGVPQSLAALCNFFKNRPEVDALQVVAFAVQPAK
jgi:serine/threonine protein kinase